MRSEPVDSYALTRKRSADAPWILPRGLIGAAALAAISSVAYAVPTGEVQYRYYCPQSNMSYAGTHDGVQLVSGPYQPFPRTRESVGIREEPARRSVDTRDCSTADYLCLRFEPAGGLAAQYLFLPRVIEPGRTYRLNGMEAITYATTAEKPPGTQVQATIWQRIDGRETAATLTVEKDRGIIYLDGLELWNSPALWPPRAEVCVLDSKQGIFREIRITQPAKRPEPLPE